MEPEAAAPAIFSIGLFFFVFVIFIAWIAMFVFWLIELIDCVKREFPDPNTKLIWILVIVFTHFIGALVYHFAGRPSGRKP